MEERLIQNFMLIYGSRPGYGVKIDTKLIRDVMRCFMELYCKVTLTVKLPAIFENLQGSDTNIEIITSSMLQTLRMSVKCFQAVRSTAHIFVQQFL